MAPAKRARPSFSPPRPKSKTTSHATHVSTATKDREAFYKNQRNAAIAKKRAVGGSAKKTPGSGKKRGRPSRVADEDDDDEDESEDDTGFAGRGRSSKGKGRSALALVDMQAGVDDDSEDDGEDEDEDAEQESEEDSEEDSRMSNTRHNQNANSSPEPDMILAEITVTNEPSVAPIPEKLVHRLLAHHFEKGDKTKISVDARDLVSRYLEVFVREAIMRSAFEKDERLSGDSGGGGGFLEVEDLEKASVQLCLDF